MFFDISQGNVTTHLRCGGIFSDSNITNVFLIVIVQKVWKLVNIRRSYKAYKKCENFGATLYSLFQFGIFSPCAKLDFVIVWQQTSKEKINNQKIE